jgi:hypothetical protein
MTISCPNCGKPLRPGVRFCGNCGSQVPAGPAQAQENAATTLCPHCNSPIRLGAKFCNNCGKAIDQAVQPAAPPPGAARPAGAPPATPPPVAGVAPQAGGQAAARPVTPVRPRRSGWLWVLAGLLVIACLLVSVGGFFYLRNQGGILSVLRGTTPSAMPLPPTTQAVPAETTEAPTATIELSPTETTGPLPTTSVPQETVPPIQDTPIVTATSTITVEMLTQEPVILLVDDFSGPLTLNWNRWGSPGAHIKPGPQNTSWLELVAQEPGAAGITSKREKPVPNAPGVVIEFDAQLNEMYPQYALTFDWDLMSYDRGPENADPGAIHLEIRRNKMQFATPMTASGCENELVGMVSHTFTLKIVDNQGVDLYLDGDGLPICRIPNMGQDVVNGRISFSGLGWVTRVLVTEPAK